MTSIRVVVMVVMATVAVFALTEKAICVHARNIHHSQLASQKNISCMLVFGDSSVDPGNNNRLKTSFKANFPPYGKNLANGQCTGRFTNGRLPTDLTAESLGIKMMIPAFLDPKLKKEDLLTGVSFASSASGYDNLTAQLTNVLSVSKQLEYLRHYKIHLREFVGKKKAEETVKNALFVLSMGTNDFIQNYFIEPNRSKEFTVEQYIDYLTICMAEDIKEMHNEGATRLVVVGLPPLGCMPLVKTISGTAGCVDRLNSVAFLMNSKIQDKLVALRSSLRMKIGYEDIYILFERATKFPKKYGFTETAKGCVGSGEIELGETCKGQSTCKDPSKYIFWDSVHPTEKMYKIISDDVTGLVKRTF
ncbi:GDSL esterase/lipase [Thalictrum thalictroides]|uniref:GDSL esterase/lipase n=1 Tax=Thalictrum thalictroides TaxID=46969 RepID=A0A7J6WUI2_THATH|nr:GDSL esterase/lipase [Thalictrum thalictroides]